MNKLKIGDKLYNKEYSRWTNSTYYKFASVERITKTQAILSDGTKLINEPTKSHYENIVGYCVYGDRYKKWSIETEDIIIEAKIERERQDIIKWFANRKFSDEDKRIIYNKFKELNLLESPNTEK